MSTKETTEITSDQHKPNTGVWIGISAILINIITVSVYMYQAHIMQQQQHASAWPYIEWLPSFNEEIYYVEISNNGIGPAIINDVQIALNGENLDSVDALFIKLLGTVQFPHLTSTIQNRVLPAGKSLRLFQVNDSNWAAKVFSETQKQQFTLTLCYSSIYGESWQSTGVIVYPGSCKK